MHHLTSALNTSVLGVVCVTMNCSSNVLSKHWCSSVKLEFVDYVTGHSQKHMYNIATDSLLIKNYLIGQSKFLWRILFAIYLLGNKWHIIKYVLVPSTLHLSRTSKFLRSLCLVLFFADKESKAGCVCENQGSKTDPESLNCHVVKLVKRWFSNRGQGHGSAEWRSLSYWPVQGLAKGGRGEALVHRGGGKSVIAEHECC